MTLPCSFSKSLSDIAAVGYRNAAIAAPLQLGDQAAGIGLDFQRDCRDRSHDRIGLLALRAYLLVRGRSLGHLPMPTRVALLDPPSVEKANQHNREANDDDAAVSMLVGFICDESNRAKASGVKREQSNSLSD
jgi:hypothetical protein